MAKRGTLSARLTLTPPSGLWHALPLPVQLKPILFPLQVRIWEIPEGGLKRNMTEALLELHGHSRRVGLVEWHPTTNNILFSAGYDYKVRGPGVSHLARAGLVGDSGERRAGDSLSMLTGMGPFGHSFIQSFIHSLHKTEHLLCTNFSWGSWGLKASFLSPLEFSGLEDHSAHNLCLVTKR